MAMPKATAFTDMEYRICVTARQLETGTTCWVAIGGPPLVALFLARRYYGRDIIYVTEDGSIDPTQEGYKPFLLGMTRTCYKALSWQDTAIVQYHSALGYFDYGVIDTAQVDEYGNINSTFSGGTHERPERRHGGAGGANELVSTCWRTILMANQRKWALPKRVDFITSPGYLDGPGARERAGLPAGTGPYRVVTDMAVFGFDEQTKRMKLLGIAAWTKLEDVLEQMGFEPLIADELLTIEPPDEEELTIMRTEIDPSGFISATRGNWIELEQRDDKWVRIT